MLLTLTGLGFVLEQAAAASENFITIKSAYQLRLDEAISKHQS